MHCSYLTRNVPPIPAQHVWWAALSVGYLTAIACSASCEVLANGPPAPLVSQWHCVPESVAVAESPALDLLAVHCTSMSMGEACTAMLAEERGRLLGCWSTCSSTGRRQQRHLTAPSSHGHVHTYACGLRHSGSAACSSDHDSIG